MFSWKIEEYLAILPLIIKTKIKNWKIGDRLQIEKISYGEDDRQYLLWSNSETKDKRDSIIFFIHGGGWSKGSPEFFKFVGNYFTELGFTTIMPAYRLVPDFRFPSQQTDIFKALKKSLQLLEESGIEKKNIIIVGQSAGAHLGGLLLLNQSEQGKYGIDKDIFSAFLSISGPLDLSFPCKTKRAKKLLSEFVPTLEKKKKANPINYIKEELKIPIFCIHGAKDPLVPREHSTRFIERIKAKNKAETKLKISDDKHHCDLTKLFFSEGEENKEVINWLMEIDKLN